MPAADELYLLFQQSKDVCANTLGKWEEHFHWLEEVVLLAKQSRGNAIIPKTPSRKRKARKNKEDAENLAPPLPPPVDSEQTSVRKSSRAAARAAVEKNKKTLAEISNLNTKLRRPSAKQESPKKQIESESIPCNDETDEVEIINDRPTSELSNASQSNKTNLVPPHNFPKTTEDSAKNEEEQGDMEPIVSQIQKNAFIIPSKDYHPKELEVNIDEFKVPPLPPPPPSPPSIILTEDKKSHTEENKVDPSESSQSQENIRPVRPTRTKKRVVEQQEQEELPARNTRTKKRKMEEVENSDKGMSERVEQEQSPMSLHLHITSESDDASECVSQRDTHCKPQPLIQNKMKSVVIPLTVNDSPQRITRSKVRQMAATNVSPARIVESQRTPKQNKSKMNNRECHTPKSQTNSPMLISKYSGSPASKSPLPKHRKNIYDDFKTSEVQEVSVESIDVTSSPGKVVKHSWNENSKILASGLRKGKPPYQTPPSIMSSSAVKTSSSKNLYSSGGLQSSNSYKRGPLLSSSPQIIGTKNQVIRNPSEVSKTKNILNGPSFLTRVQPSRPTREESEERKHEELKKKREKEEETRKKKEELLRVKTEEQKRRNEERMRKAQETREAIERKAAEAREVQEKEKREREERIKEEKKRKIIAKKNEEMKQQMLRKQAEEEQRLKEEQRLREEQKLKEEQILMKEQRAREELRKMEEARIKLEDERREAERIVREKVEQKKLEQKKLREAERIAREKKEMEQLKFKEAERKNSPKKLNETYSADVDGRPLNTTYSKPPPNDDQKNKAELKQSYDMTPLVKEKPAKSKNPHDYGIADLRSDDSTDEDCAPKKEIPLWARGSQLRKYLFDQEHYPPDIDGIFPPQILLAMPDLSEIFPKKKRSRFNKRTSSAVWNTPPYRVIAVAR